LHHILDADNDQYLVSAGKDLAKVRTTSHMGPGRSRQARFAFQAGRLYHPKAAPPGVKKEEKRCAVMRRTPWLASKWW
jgi:hypothetical protein